MPVPWAIIGTSAIFIVVAIMTFFGCCCPRAWFGGNQDPAHKYNRDSAAPRRPPQGVDFLTIRYSDAEQGPPPTTQHGDDEASLFASQISPGTTPTNAAGTPQDASSSVYSQPTNPPTPPPSDDVRQAEQGESSLEAVNVPANGANETVNVADGEELTAEDRQAMKRLWGKIPKVRMSEEEGGVQGGKVEVS